MKRLALIIGLVAALALAAAGYGSTTRTTTTTSSGVSAASGNRSSATRTAELRRYYPRLQELLDAEHMKSPPRAPKDLRPTITNEFDQVGQLSTNSQGVLRLSPVPVTERVSAGSAGHFWLSAQLGVVCANHFELPPPERDPDPGR